MKMPWTGRTGLAKAAVFFVTLLGVSFGLCGVNFLGSVAFEKSIRNSGVNGLIVTTAYLEVAGMLLGLAGLVITGLIALGMTIFGRITKQKDGE